MIFTKKAQRLVGVPVALSCIMSVYSFRLLCPEGQLRQLLLHGTFLASRWAETPVALYHCLDDGPGFFAEIGYKPGNEQPLVLRSFVRAGLLENYSHYVRRPQGWTT